MTLFMSYETWREDHPLYVAAKDLFDEEADLENQRDTLAATQRKERAAIRERFRDDADAKMKALEAYDDANPSYWDGDYPWAKRIGEIEATTYLVERLLKKEYRAWLANNFTRS